MHARPPQLEEHLRCTVYVANFYSELGYHRRKLLVAHRVSARRASLPRVVAPAGHHERGAQLQLRPDILVGEDVLELRLIRRLAYGCLLAKKALTLKASRSPSSGASGPAPAPQGSIAAARRSRTPASRCTESTPLWRASAPARSGRSGAGPSDHSLANCDNRLRPGGPASRPSTTQVHG